MQRGEALLVDVREPDEHRRRHVAGSRLEPLGTFDPSRVLAAAPDRRVVFLCRSGRRSQEAAMRFFSSTGIVASELVGGIEAWKSAGLPVVEDAGAPLPLMRQVQITIGLLVVAFTALGVLLDPWFLAVPAFLGSGLVFAGITGSCGLATVLSWMPWNRRRPG